MHMEDIASRALNRRPSRRDSGREALGFDTWGRGSRPRMRASFDLIGPLPLPDRRSYAWHSAANAHYPSLNTDLRTLGNRSHRTPNLDLF